MINSVGNLDILEKFQDMRHFTKNQNAIHMVPR